MKAIETYKAILREFGVTDEDTVSPVGKMTYVQEQVGQQRAIINRLLFDMTTSKIHMEAAKDDISKDAHRKKFADYLNDLRQLLVSVRINLQLVDELREEYPELRVDTGVDNGQVRGSTAG